MGTKTKPGAYDGYAKALPDEPMFVLLARDPNAPNRVLEWAVTRETDIRAGRQPDSDMTMVQEARECADAMRTWRRRNLGAWRDAKS